MSIVYLGKATPASGSGGGSITVDQTYDALSTNAQSGTAVAEAVATKQDVIDANNKLSVSYVSGLATVATTGDYGDLLNTPTIPTVIPADNSTITENTSNQLQTVGIINQNTNVGAVNSLKVWNGTEQEWNTGGNQIWYNWKNSSMEPINWSSGYNVFNPSDANTIYVNGQYICVGGSGYYVDTSFDGINWFNAAIIAGGGTVISGEARGIAYGNGKYIIVGGPIFSSTDLTHWTFISQPSNELRSVIYVNNKFIAVGNSGIILSSADGTNWTTETSGVSTDLYSIAYGNGKYIAVGNNGTILSSTDGSVWTSETIDSSVGMITKIIYANEQFILIFGDTNYMFVGVAYSSDGSTWTIDKSITLWYGLGSSLAYGNGILYVGNEHGSLYFDGSNWSTLEEDKRIKSIIFTNGKFLVRSGTFANIVTGGFSSVFTDTIEPTTASTVYSEPSVTSALTITAVGTGTITLSDTNTYDYNASGNQTTTSSVGRAHPDWICNIDGVGVKIGTTDVANLASYTAGTNIAINNGVISATDTTYSAFGGATSQAAGSAGLVPAPTTGDVDKYLKGDGTWGVISSGGLQNTATGTDSLTILGTPATDAISVNIGVGSSVNSYGAVAIGYAAEADNYGVAIGGYNNDSSSGTHAYMDGIAIGCNAVAGSQNGDGGIAIGYFTTASSSSVAIGLHSMCNSTESVAIGDSSSVSSAGNDIAIGNSSSVSASDSIAIGVSATVTGRGSIALGSGAESSQNYELVVSDGGYGDPGITYQLMDLTTGKIPNDRINGATGSFTSQDGKTVTVTNGVITNIA